MKRHSKNLFLVILLLILAQKAHSQCGLMFVSGNDTGYGGNVQSPVLAANDVAYTWSFSQPQANEFAIFQTHDPWGLTMIKTAINNAGYTYTVFAPAALTGFNFAAYSVVILNWDDSDVSDFDPPYTSVIPALQTYVQNGGVLWLQGGIQPWGGLTYNLPFGGIGTSDLESNDWIDNTASLLVAGVVNPFPGTYASHASYTGYPAGAQQIVSVGTGPGGATVQYVYQTGTGLCPPTATPNQTLTSTPTSTLTPTSTPSFTPTTTSTNTPNLTWTHTSTPTVTPTSTPLPPCDNFYVSKNVFSSGQPVSIYVCTSEYPGNLSLTVYNSAGENIKTLGQASLSGPYQQSYTWDGTNKFGDVCATGVYIFCLNLPLETKRARIVWIH